MIVEEMYMFTSSTSDKSHKVVIIFNMYIEWTNVCSTRKLISKAVEIKLKLIIRESEKFREKEVGNRRCLT